MAVGADAVHLHVQIPSFAMLVVVCDEGIITGSWKYRRVQCPDGPLCRVQSAREEHEELVGQLQRRDAG